MLKCVALLFAALYVFDMIGVGYHNGEIWSAVCCSVQKFVHSVLQRATVCCSKLLHVAACGIVL